MSAFSHRTAKRSRRPPGKALLRPKDFADTWADKPGEDVEVGLRVISEQDWFAARAESRRRADLACPGGQPRDVWVEAYNQSMVHQAIAASCTHPDNIDEPYWDMAEDIVPIALSRGGAEHLYDEIELLHLVQSPLSQEATGEELVALSDWLRSPDWAGMLPGDVGSFKRLAHRLAEMVAKRGAGSV